MILTLMQNGNKLVKLLHTISYNMAPRNWTTQKANPCSNSVNNALELKETAAYQLQY